LARDNGLAGRRGTARVRAEARATLTAHNAVSGDGDIGHRWRRDMAVTNLQRPLAQRQNSFQLFSWYYLRVSGVVLVFLALTHMFITHYLNVPSETTFEFVANRWANPLWRTFDWLLLFLAVTHGLNGLQLSVDDYLHKPQLRVAAQAVVYMSALIFIALGTVTIFTFNPDPVNGGPLNDQMWIAKAVDYSLVLVAILTYVSAALFVVWVGSTIARGGAPIYWGDVGQYAWVLHRATGIGVTFFLLVHIVDIALIGLGRDVYNETIAFYATPFLIPMEIALVGAVVYHSLNGIRILLIDFWKPVGVRYERPLFFAMAALTVLLTVPSGIIIVNHVFHLF
jgi:succinate dehydrogenase / fumarate reductase membrane anchor subunit